MALRHQFMITKLVFRHPRVLANVDLRTNLFMKLFDAVLLPFYGNPTVACGVEWWTGSRLYLGEIVAVLQSNDNFSIIMSRLNKRIEGEILTNSNHPLVHLFGFADCNKLVFY